MEKYDWEDTVLERHWGELKPEKVCAPPAKPFKTCTGWGDPHFTESFFSTKTFHFQGVGVYRLATDVKNSFEIQAFQCPYGSTKASVFAGFALKIDGKRMSIIGDTVSSGGANVSAGHSAKGISLCSDDNSVYFNTRLRKTKHSPGFYHNMKIMMASASVADKGVCGLQTERQPVQHDASLFSTSDLERLCTLCGQSANCVPKTGEQKIITPTPWSPPAGPQEACDGAVPKIPYATAMEKCKVFKEDTKDVANANRVLFACIYDYCATGGDDDAVQNLLDVHKHFTTTTTTTTTTIAPPAKRCYTLLWYVNADNNLGQPLVKQVRESMFAYFNHGNPKEFAVNILIDQSQAVKQSLFPPSSKDFSKAHSFLLGSTQVEDAVEWGEIDMDNSSVLEQFIAQGKAKYPAENYILLISGHGGGLQRGFGGDVDSFRQKGGKYLYDPIGMSIPELVQGLSGGMGDDKFALMAFDAGLMQDFGVAYAVAPYTDLYLASQDVQSQFGFNWNAMRTVFGKPCTQTISQIRKILVDSYKISDNCICDPNDFNKTTDTAKGLSLAVVDTSVLSKFTDTFVNLVDALRCDLAYNSNKAAVGIGRARAQEMFFPGAEEATGVQVLLGANPPMVDLGSMLSHIGQGYNYSKGEEKCVTSWGNECQFPFTYKGVVHTSCTMEAHTNMWCSTKVDSKGVHVSSLLEGGLWSWGNCADVCFQGKFDPSAHFADETRTRALIAKAAYDELWDYSRISAELKNEHATGMGFYWPPACHMDSKSYAIAKSQQAPQFADLLSSIDYASGCWFLDNKFPEPEEAVCSGALAIPCATTAASPCVFPFKYKGTTYDRCTDAGQYKPWCSIEVDINGEHVTSSLLGQTWGYCSDSCSRDCATDCNTCDMAKADKCTICGNGKYLTPAGKCEPTCPAGTTKVGKGYPIWHIVGRVCQKTGRRLVTETKLSLSKLGASTFTAKLPTKHSVGSVMFNATVNADSKGKITDATAMLGKSSDDKKITWFKQMKGWFKDQSDLVHASMRDTSIKLTQHHDGQTGCDKQETVFCQYSLIHAATCPAGDLACSPTHIGCKVPVQYLPVGANQVAQSGTLSVKLDFNTGKSTSMTLTAGNGNGFRAEVSNSAAGTITPTLWETPVTVTDFEKQKTAVTSKVSFDWSRKVEFSLGPAVSGKTYVALVATDHKNNQAHVMKAVPDHNIPKGESTSLLPVWQAMCADEAKKVKITGSLSFEASGLKQDEVEAATKAALAFTFDVNPSLIEVTATQARRLESDTRRLANSWTVKYAVQVAETKAAAVKKAITNIQKNPTEFRGKLEVAVNNLPSTSGARKTISKFTIAAPVSAAGETSGTKTPTGTRDEAITGSTTSQWLSSAVAVLVVFIGSM